jgi:hypothetical protein
MDHVRAVNRSFPRRPAPIDDQFETELTPHTSDSRLDLEHKIKQNEKTYAILYAVNKNEGQQWLRMRKMKTRTYMWRQHPSHMYAKCSCRTDPRVTKLENWSASQVKGHSNPEKKKTADPNLGEPKHAVRIGNSVRILHIPSDSTQAAYKNTFEYLFPTDKRIRDQESNWNEVISRK